QHLAQVEPAHGAVVGGEAAVLEDRVADQVGRHHLDDDAGLVGGLLEVGEDLLARGVVGPERDDVVVVEGDGPGAELGELRRVLARVEGGPGGRAELVVGGPADRPEAEGELVVGGGLAHHRVAPLLVVLLLLATYLLGAAASSARRRGAHPPATARPVAEPRGRNALTL